MEVGEEKGCWVSPPVGSATKSPWKRDQGQELQKLFLWAHVQDWSQGVLLWDPSNTVHTTQKATLPLFAAGSQADLTLGRQRATTRERACALQIKESGAASRVVVLWGVSLKCLWVWHLWTNAVGYLSSSYVPFFIAKRTRILFWQPWSQQPDESHLIDQSPS